MEGASTVDENLESEQNSTPLPVTDDANKLLLDLRNSQTSSISASLESPSKRYGRVNFDNDCLAEFDPLSKNKDGTGSCLTPNDTNMDLTSTTQSSHICEQLVADGSSQSLSSVEENSSMLSDSAKDNRESATSTVFENYDEELEKNAEKGEMCAVQLSRNVR